MSKYTTGEIAKLCGVTVRTVQYYDTRGILVPTELSEGGRRLYSEDDLERMKIICFLRDLGLPIDSIGQLLSEENPGNVISLLLEQQEQTLKEEIDERTRQLSKLEGLKEGLKSVKHFSVQSIGDIAHIMSNKEKLKKSTQNLSINRVAGLAVSANHHCPMDSKRILVAICSLACGCYPLWYYCFTLLFWACCLYLPTMPHYF